jgi:hypothetical protein
VLRIVLLGLAARLTVLSLVPLSAGCPKGTTSAATVSATVVGTGEVFESAPFERVHVQFVNHSDAAILVVGYTIAWPGGGKAIDDVEFRIDSGKSVDRWARTGTIGTIESFPLSDLRVESVRTRVP